ncbi:unnamed protein product [Choristocarpus tenellus]
MVDAGLMEGSSLLLAMALNCGRDGVLTRDAETIREYITLMSSCPWKRGEGAEEGGGPKVKQQQLLSLGEALDKAENSQYQRPRPKTLISLAEVLRPPKAKRSVRVRGGGEGINRGGGRASVEAEVETCEGVMGGEEGDAGGASADAGGKGSEHFSTSAWGERQERTLDPYAIMCPFELNGVCNDEQCRYQHVADFVSPTQSRLPSTSGSVASMSPPQSTPNAPEGTAGSGKQSPYNPAPSRMSSSDSSGKEVRLVGVGSKGKQGGVSSAGVLKGLTSTSEMQEHGGERRYLALPDIEFGEPTGEENQRAKKRKLGFILGWGKGKGGIGEHHGDAGNCVEVEMEVEGEGEGEGDGNEGGRRGGETRATKKTCTAMDATGIPQHKAEANDSETGFLAFTPAATTQGEDTNGDSVGLGNWTPASAPAAFALALLATTSGSGFGGHGERYYDSGDSLEGCYDALNDVQLEALEAHLEETPSDVEVWLLLAMQRLPRGGESTAAIWEAVEEFAQLNEPFEDDGPLRPSLRTLVRGLEHVEGSGSESLWLLYLRLYVLRPGKIDEARGFCAEALEKLPTSRPVWRLYRHLWGGVRQALPEVLQLYFQQLEQLVYQSMGTYGNTSEDLGNVGIEGVGDTVEAAGEGVGTSLKADSSCTGNSIKDESGGDSIGSRNDSSQRLAGMMVYLVLERCSFLAQAGYTLQGVVEVLEALGAKRSQWWTGVKATGKETVTDGVTTGVGSGELMLFAQQHRGGDHDRGHCLPQGLAPALAMAPHSLRSLLWLAAVHLLVFGVFPQQVLFLAEGKAGGGDEGVTDDNGMESELDKDTWALVWQPESLLPNSPMGRRLAASPQQRLAAREVFFSAIEDIGLTPPRNWVDDGKVTKKVLEGGVGNQCQSKENVIMTKGGGGHGHIKGKAKDHLGVKGTNSSHLFPPVGPTVSLVLNWLAYCNAAAARGEGGKEEMLRLCRWLLCTEPVPKPALFEHLTQEYPQLIEKYLRGGNWGGHSTPSVEAVKYTSLQAPGYLQGATPGEASTLLSPAVGGAAQGKVEQAVGSDKALQVPRGWMLFPFLCALQEELKNTLTRTGDVSEAISTVWAGGGTGEAEPGTASAVAQEALIELWVEPEKWKKVASSQERGGVSVEAAEWMKKQDDVLPARLAEMRARSALMKWADGESGGVGRTMFQDETTNLSIPGVLETRGILSVIFLTIWVLGSPVHAIEALDHVLSSESFAGIAQQRRQLLWFYRFEATAAIARHEASEEAKEVGSVQDTILRALADDRARLRGRHATLAQYVAGALGNFDDPGPNATDPPITSTKSSVIFVQDMLRGYAAVLSGEQHGVGRVDWVVAEEALSSTRRRGVRHRALPPAGPTLSLMRWAWEAGMEGVEGAGRARGGKAAMRNTRPHAEKALASNPGDPELATAVAVLESEAGDSALAQRALEAALRHRPCSASLWEARVALEAAHGRGSRERAAAVAAAAAASGVLLQLPCCTNPASQVPSISCHTSSNLIAPSPRPPDMVGRVLLNVSDPVARKEKRSLSLQGLLVGNVNVATEFPLSALLLTGLVSLSLAGNNLCWLPSSLSRLTSLRALDLTGNSISALPHSIGLLKGLRVLRLASNRVHEILPAEVLGGLSELRLLDAENNLLAQFPEAVLSLKRLRTLKLAGNPIPTASIDAGVAPRGLLDALPELEVLSLPTPGQIEAKVPR